ncbi:MAG: helix-turn-helix domain-containing protein [Candidatus Shapirobacteria bacterium]|jgi:cytoskeletal protein RodZ
MKRASSILESTRLDRELDFIEISKKTKIPLKYLIAFENEKIADFPQEPYCSLMLKDYADFLGLNGEEVLSLFRRDYDRKSSISIPRHFLFSLTPQFAFTLFISLLILVFAVYLTSEYLKFNRPPRLKVNWPQNLSGKNIEISGLTDSQATVKINDSLVIVDKNGNFQKDIEISTSEAKIVVEAKSPAGKTTQDEKVLK